MSTETPPTPPVVLDQIHLNDTVELALNDHGKSIFEAHLKSIMPDNPNKAPDKIKLQLWEMSAIFGPHIGIGKPTPFDTTLKHTGRQGTPSLRTLNRYDDSSIPDVKVRETEERRDNEYTGYSADDRAMRGIMSAIGLGQQMSIHVSPVYQMGGRWEFEMKLGAGGKTLFARLNLAAQNMLGSSFHETLSRMIGRVYAEIHYERGSRPDYDENPYSPPPWLRENFTSFANAYGTDRAEEMRNRAAHIARAIGGIDAAFASPAVLSEPSAPPHSASVSDMLELERIAREVELGLATQLQARPFTPPSPERIQAIADQIAAEEAAVGNTPDEPSNDAPTRDAIAAWADELLAQEPEFQPDELATRA